MGPKFLKVALVIIAVGFICGIVNAAVTPQTEPEPQAAAQVAEPVQEAAAQVTDPAAEAIGEQPSVSAEEPAVEENTDALAKRKEMFAKILDEKKLHFSFGSIAKGILGIAVIVLIAWLCSTDRKKVNWKTVGMALLLKAVCLLLQRTIFSKMGLRFLKILRLPLLRSSRTCLEWRL